MALFHGLYTGCWQSLGNYLTHLSISENDEIHTAQRYDSELHTHHRSRQSEQNWWLHGNLKSALFCEQSSGLTVPKLLACTTPGLNVQIKYCFTFLTQMTWKTCGALWRLSSLGVDSAHKGIVHLDTGAISVVFLLTKLLPNMRQKLANFQWQYLSF